MCIMKFFNSQNCQRRKYKTVWLNIDDRNCSSVSFWYDDHEGHDFYQVTAKDFARAKERRLNFAYAGGINQSNYSESVTKQGNYYTFTYQLNKLVVDHDIFGIHTVYDYAKAIFKDGEPVDSFSITIDVYAGQVTNTSFLTAKDKGYSSSLWAESFTDDTQDPMRIDPPYIKVIDGSSYVQKAMTTALAINMQTRLNYGDAPGYAIRRNTDDIGGPRDIPVAAWFIQFQAEYLHLYVVLDSAHDSFLFNSQDPRASQHTAYQWYSDESSEGTENTIDSYQNTIAFS